MGGRRRLAWATQGRAAFLMGEGRSDLQQVGIEVLDEVDKRNIHLNQETSHSYSEGSVLITERWV